MKKIINIIPSINYIRGFFKPQFENRLQLKSANKVFFKADKLKDILEMSGWGIPRNGSAIPGHSVCDKMKVSENSKYEAALMREIKKHTNDCDQWHVCYLTFDFDQNLIFTEVWYLAKSGQKQFKKFQSKI